MKITIREFEAAVLELEDILIVVRAESSSQVYDYDYERRASETSSIKEWLENRIKPCIDGKEVVIIDGNYCAPHGRTRLSTLRGTYER